MGTTDQSPSQAYGLGAACGPSLRGLLLMPGPGRRRRRPTVDSSCNKKALAPGGHFLTTEPGKGEK